MQRVRTVSPAPVSCGRGYMERMGAPNLGHLTALLAPRESQPGALKSRCASVLGAIYTGCQIRRQSIRGTRPRTPKQHPGCGGSGWDCKRNKKGRGKLHHVLTPNIITRTARARGGLKWGCTSAVALGENFRAIDNFQIGIRAEQGGHRLTWVGHDAEQVGSGFANRARLDTPNSSLARSDPSRVNSLPFLSSPRALVPTVARALSEDG
jgi:hypothetical protein